MSANQTSRRQRALVLVRNRITFWGGFASDEPVEVDGTTVVPSVKLAKAQIEEAALLGKLKGLVPS